MPHMAHIEFWRLQFERLEGAYAPATMRGYVSDVEIYVAWCRSRRREPFPASVEAICAFLEDQAPALAPTTVRRRLYSIRKIYRRLDLPDPTHAEDINLTLRRIRRAKLGRPRQAKGLTRDYLKKFLEVQPETPWGWRNRAMLSLGYDLLTRRAELVALRTEDVTWRADGTLSVLIRRSEADPFGHGRLAFTSRRSAKLLARWLDWRGNSTRPLFCPIYRNVPIRRHLSATTVKRIIKTSANKAGLDPDQADAFSGHSMRVGAAQDLLSAGHDSLAIMRAGGWKSINVLARYLEQAEFNVWA